MGVETRGDRQGRAVSIHHSNITLRAVIIWVTYTECYLLRI
jgi:hypothetical protein